MKKINGKQNELEFVRYLNNKKVCDLNILMLEVIEILFEHFNQDSVIHS